MRRVEHLEARSRPRQGRAPAPEAGPQRPGVAEAGQAQERWAKRTRINVAALKDAGFLNTFAGTFPVHTHVVRPSGEEAQIAALVALGTINSKNLWVVVRASAFNSAAVMKAQAAILEKADNATAAAVDAAALELVQAEVAAAGAKAWRQGRLGHAGRRPGGSGEVRAHEGRPQRVELVQHQSQARRVPRQPFARVDRAGALRWLRRAPCRGGADHVAGHGGGRASPSSPAPPSSGAPLL